MKPSSLILLLPLVLIVAALRGSADPTPSEPHIGAIERHAVVAETRVRPLVISGHLAPVDHEELRLVCLQPRTGEVLEVVDHGTFVNEGDMVLRLDPRSLERELVLAERALRAAERAHVAGTAAEKVDTASAKARMDKAATELERAREALRVWNEVELPQQVRAGELAGKRGEASIADAEEELRQLEAMYRADELVQATEEIVLSRSRRNLAALRAAEALAAERRAHELEHEVPLATARLRDAVAEAERAVEHLEWTRESNAAERAATLQAAEDALLDARQRVTELRSDISAFLLRAPRSGVVLHGSSKDWEAGVPARLVAGMKLASGEAVVLVADPDRLGLRARVNADTRRGLKVSGAGMLRAPGLDGVPASYLLDAYPDSGHTFGLRATVEVPLSGFTAGSRASLLVEQAASAEESVTIPESGLHGTEGSYHCWIAGDGAGVYRRVPVRLLRRVGGEAVVSGEISAGARALLAEESGAGEEEGG